MLKLLTILATLSALSAAHAAIYNIDDKLFEDRIYAVAECNRYQQQLTATANSVTVFFDAQSPLYVRVSNTNCSTVENYVAVSPNSTLYKYMYTDTKLNVDFNLTAETNVICVSVCYRGANGEFDVGGIYYKMKVAVTPIDNNPVQNYTEVVQQVNKLTQDVAANTVSNAVLAQRIDALSAQTSSNDLSSEVTLLRYGFIILACVCLIEMVLIIYLIVRPVYADKKILPSTDNMATIPPYASNV